MSCREWRLKLPAEKTLRNFQVFFTAADADRRDNKVPMPFKTSSTMRSTTSLQNIPLRSLHNPNQQFLSFPLPLLKRAPMQVSPSTKFAPSYRNLCPSNKANRGRVAMGTAPVFLASTTIAAPLPTTTEEEQEDHKLHRATMQMVLQSPIAGPMESPPT